MAAVSRMPPSSHFRSGPAPAQSTTSNPSSTANSISSSPGLKAIDLRGPIPEEEDETASETGNEPVTPTDNHHPHHFRDTSNDDALNGTAQPESAFTQMTAKVPILVNTAATPPPPAAAKADKANVTPAAAADNHTPPQSPSQGRPSVKRGFSGFFKRSQSHLGSSTPTENSLTHGAGGSDSQLTGGRRLSTRGLSARTSPNTTRSNTPPSPESPPQDGGMLHQAKTAGNEPQSTQFLPGRKERSATGLGFRGIRWGNTFGNSTPAEKRSPNSRYRATSVGLEGSPQPLPKQLQQQPQAELTKHYFAIGPQEGTGLKARRMSLNLPDDFMVDVVDLHKEFSDQSKLLGRRGKSLGKGATAEVNLMTRKGFGSELYAVKCFRAKGRDENAEDYEKKVKSEYSIAKSLHHPNIVETIRLCTDKGRWNHVMEYCQEGDLFGLVQKGYLKAKDRAVDRECLFKQLVQGIEYLHCHGIAHRDIKLENLLLTKDSKLKITDFGVSEVFSGIHPGVRAAGGQCGVEMTEVRLCAPAICGSLPYIAPEVVEKKRDYDPRPLDVWSSAIVMLHLIFGGALWNKATLDNQGYKYLVDGWEKWEAKHPEGGSITETDYPYVNAFDMAVNPPALRRLLLGMLHPDPAKRSTIEDVANNRWLKKVECCQVNSYDDPTTMIDASKKKHCITASHVKVVHHNHLPPASHRGHHLIRLPGSTDMD